MREFDLGSVLFVVLLYLFSDRLYLDDLRHLDRGRALEVAAGDSRVNRDLLMTTPFASASPPSSSLLVASGS